MINRKIVSKVNLLDKYQKIINQSDPIRSLGTVTDITGKIIFSIGPEVSLGELCHITLAEEDRDILCEVVGFRGEKVILSPLDTIAGIFPGCRVLSTGSRVKIALSDSIIGRILDGLGRPLDNESKIYSDEVRFLENDPPNPIERPLIDEPLPTGIKAIDSLLTLGKGQRIGIFSGSGVGKSTLMGMIARYSKADINVIALIGERGREVQEFIIKELGEEGMAKSVMIVASSNESPMHRVRAAYMATTVAEYFRDEGKDVLLMMDSITRLAMAQREVGLAAGEPATTKGYPPSVFSMMPELLERAGTAKVGTITGIYTVLVEADDMNEPIADAARGILDGHIVLSRKLASRSHYPAIDISESISRSMQSVVDEEHYNAAASIKEMLSEYKENEDIINLGAYTRGGNRVLDNAIITKDVTNKLLRQKVNEYSTFEDSEKMLKQIEKSLHVEERPSLRRAG